MKLYVCHLEPYLVSPWSPHTPPKKSSHCALPQMFRPILLHCLRTHEKEPPFHLRCPPVLFSGYFLHSRKLSLHHSKVLIVYFPSSLFLLFYRASTRLFPIFFWHICNIFNNSLSSRNNFGQFISIIFYFRPYQCVRHNFYLLPNPLYIHQHYYWSLRVSGSGSLLNLHC